MDKIVRVSGIFPRGLAGFAEIAVIFFINMVINRLAGVLETERKKNRPPPFDVLRWEGVDAPG